jgi:FSR family fosmidomycin resistance protein-like MFS transporter
MNDTQAASTENSLARKTIFSVVCGTHFFNHFQSTMLGVLYPVMMRELGIGLLAIGTLTAAYNTIANIFQAVYGLIAPHVRRATILGIGNLVLGISVLATGFASSYTHILATRVVGGVGSSPQHPAGSAMLATYFGQSRGRALALHSTAGHLGGLLGPILAALLIAYLGWRGIFWTIGILSILAGLSCFAFKESVRPDVTASVRSRHALGWGAYKKCLQNKSVLLISLVLMVGAAGRGQGINETYIIPHFVNDLHVDLTHAAFLFTLIQVGSLFGPMIWGWVSDRFDRKLTIQASLLFSALSTLWLGWQESVSAELLANLVFYGAAVTSRQTLTQALLSDIVDEETLDAAFSLYYFIGFISIPFWTVITGGIMAKYGFGPAFSVISTSYLLGMALLSFLRRDGFRRS